MDLPSELWISVLSYLELPDRISFAKVIFKPNIFCIIIPYATIINTSDFTTINC